MTVFSTFFVRKMLALVSVILLKHANVSNGLSVINHHRHYQQRTAYYPIRHGPLYMSSSTETKTSRSTRLDKARRLLLEYQKVDQKSVENSNNNKSRQSSSEPTIATRSSTNAANKKLDTYKTNSSNGGADADADNVKTVPDMFWSNGHLQEGSGDYVTRWAGGAKIAEPLMQYDPVAAEKLLFRQPTKVSVSYYLRIEQKSGAVHDVSLHDFPHL